LIPPAPARFRLAGRVIFTTRPLTLSSKILEHAFFTYPAITMILVIDNYDSFTWNLVQLIGTLCPGLELDKDVKVVRHDKITPDEADALDGGSGPSHLLISPGPCTPDQSGISRAMIKHFAGQIPVLGVCLGHQCIADLAGMKVVQHHRPVHGKTSEIHHDGQGIFAGVPSPFIAARYHSLVVPTESVPEPPAPGEDGFVVSAWTDEPETDGNGGACGGGRVVMGLRRVWADATKAPVEGVQFHPESFLTAQGPKLLANFLGLDLEEAQAGLDSPRKPIFKT